MPRRAVYLLMALLAMGTTSAVWSQEARATIGGRVVDAQGALVPNASVTVVSEETQVAQTTQTNPQGNWVIRFLLPGHYSFAVTAPGFKRAEQRGIELQTADNKLFDTALEVGETSMSVT